MANSYIAFLRAVNVGGRIVKMDRLSKLFEDLGFAKVRTHIQSGNVSFETRSSKPDALARKIETHLEAELGFDVPTFVRSVEDVEHVIALDPFKKVVVTPDVRLCVIFISKPLPKTAKLPMQSPTGEFEILSATPGEAFVVVRVNKKGMGNPSAYLEKTFGLAATARFFHTTEKILAAAKTT
jgi:uncharacterized protein (DUF1697 family)